MKKTLILFSDKNQKPNSDWAEETIFAKNNEGFVKHWEQHVDGIVRG